MGTIPDRGASPGPRPLPPRVEDLDAAQRARRERIVVAAVELMQRRAYDDVQMKDVTAAAGVALGTTYRYFSSKEHLFAEALLAWAQHYRADPPNRRDRGRGVDHLKAAYHRAVRAFERHPHVYGHLLAIQATTDPAAVAVFDRFARHQNEAFATALGRVPSPKRERVVRVMNAVLDANLRDWTLGRSPIASVHAQLDAAAELLLG